MAIDNSDWEFYLNQAQRFGDKDVTCMQCKHFPDVGKILHCYLEDKKIDLDTPAYDCPSFEYDEDHMPKEVYEEKKKEEEMKKQENDLRYRGNFTFAVFVCLGCIISLAFVLSKETSEFEAAIDIVIGIIVTGVLTYLAYKA